jgi:hypothetical protein
MTSSRKQINVLYHDEQTRKVVIFQREDGNYGFEEFRFGVKEQAWFPVGRYSEAFVESSESALREARARITWLSDSIKE